VVQSPRTSWQPRPKLVPALKPNPPSAQRWPLRHRRPTVTAGRAGNDDGLRALVAVESPVDAAVGGEGADSDRAGMDVDPQPPASKRGRRSQGKEQQTPAMPPTVKNDNASGRITRSKAAGPAGVQRLLIAMERRRRSRLRRLRER
jgi:hypothetical protein